MTGAIGGILSAARIIREGTAEHTYDGARDMAITRYELREGDHLLFVNVRAGHEADTLAQADRLAAELVGSKA